MEHPHDPLHGKTLKIILESLVEAYGWPELYRRVKINCFKIEPSVTSSLKFLRKTPWARAKVEDLYLEFVNDNKPENEFGAPINLKL